ncbi:helix-turn-helix domain-containing protein [Stutzerimonas stutzeri]|uniref:helix-turn-helix domain-containing protein n=1 Tax=Stutzerimonas stutzeri TaxID=316 RepID=UPI0009A3FBF6|nr:helix-turn-helix domain-containing protein [Stutzerimonas stutzeri]OPG82090.1 helix-turn-helix domain-containing protein [Stutzerimonas stutzeri]
MATSKATTSSNVVALRPSKAEQVSDKKWSKPVMKLGFCIIPSLLLRAQQRLGLNPTQLAVLLQLADYWWDQDRKPYPSKQALSERLGLSPRQIQRYIAELEAAGLVQRIERRAAHRGKLSNEYDLSGLVERLKKIAPEIEQANEIKRQATRRGGLQKVKTIEE